MLVVTAAEMRRLDQWTIERGGVAGFMLMERAGAGAAECLLLRFPDVRQGRVAIVAGKGNNGGDGFVVARLLRAAGVEVDMLLLARRDDLGGDARTAMEAWATAGGAVVEVADEAAAATLAERLTRATLVVDAIFGTGLSAAVEGRYAVAIDAINHCGRPVFALDLPSGVDADRGVALGAAVRAAATATFGYLKFALAGYPGLDCAGEVDVVDIGIAAEAVAEVAPAGRLTTRAEAAGWLPLRGPMAHKGDCGHVLVLAGSLGHSGAARLAARASVRGGAGLTTLAGPASLNAILAVGGDEWMTLALPDRGGWVRYDAAAIDAALEGKRAVVLGPGLGTHPAARRVVRHVVRSATMPVVCDADALTCLAREPEVLRRARAPLVLTPHPGEMGRLAACDAAAVQADRPGVARRFVREHGCTLLLKGARSIVATADGGLHINPTGNPGMASGGMGDALAGLLGALLAQGLKAEDAARLAAYVHGDAADRVARRRGMIGMSAGDVIEEFPPALAGLAAVARCGESARGSE